MSLQDMHSFDGILGLTLEVHSLHIGHGIHNHVGEEITLGIQKFGAHGSFGGIDQSFSSKLVGLDSQMALNVLD